MSAHMISSAGPEWILKDLGKLRASIPKGEIQVGQPAVVRACLLTLIVAVRELDGGRVVTETLSELPREHPSRTIVLAVSEDLKEAPQMRVLTQSRKGIADAQQISCEQIEVRLRPEDWPEVESLLQGLAADDLPVIFWYSIRSIMAIQPAQVLINGLESIMRLARKTIVDTQGCPAEDALSHLVKWRGENRIVADLEWTRLTRWRELIAHLFDDPARPNHFSAFDNIEVAYTGENPGLASFYIGAWLSTLNRATVTFKRAQGHGPGLHAITMHAINETVVLERIGKERMSISSASRCQRHFNYSDRNPTALLVEELGIAGPDPVFDTTFVRAQNLVREYI